MTHDPNCRYCNDPIGVLYEIIVDESQYQHWRLDKSGLEAFVQVTKWMEKIKCHDKITLNDGREIVPNHENQQTSSKND